MPFSAVPESTCDGSRQASRVIAVVVSFRPDLGTLHRLLVAALPQVDGLILVDNEANLSASDLGVFERAVELLSVPSNEGLAAAQNRGIRRALDTGAGQILLLDQDSVPSAGMVSELVRVSQTLAAGGVRVGAVGPRYTGRMDEEPSRFVRFGRLSFSVTAPAAGASSVECDFLIASGSLIPAECLRKVGLMDAGLFIDHVDTEWCLRAAAQGYRFFGVAAALMQHGLGERTRRLWFLRSRKVAQHAPFRYYYMFRNSLLLMRRPYAPRAWKRCDRTRLLQILIFFGLLSGPRRLHLRMMLRGARDGWRGLQGPMQVASKPA